MHISGGYLNFFLSGLREEIKSKQAASKQVFGSFAWLGFVSPIDR